MCEKSFWLHTAGDPGRGELDDKQEINYRPVMEAIADTGLDGYVGHEFMRIESG